MKIVVPVRIEGKYLDKPQQVSSPLADFTKLPWTDGKSDHNFEQPYVADGIIHEPFGDENTFMGTGLHLHFIIPHYLGRPAPEFEQSSKAKATPPGIPAAPNRWLITKTEGTAVTQWVVESDYVHHQSYHTDQAACIIPASKGQPYRFMGRTTLLSDARPAGDTFKDIHGTPLTVMAHGDPNFSSFYPNCAGVFGFHDPSSSCTSKPHYSVIGWNENEADDLFYQTISELYSKDAKISADEMVTQLENLFKIDLSLNRNTITSTTIPRTLFYGEIEFGSGFELISGDPDTADLKISIGNTSSEALSALMGDELGSGVEDQLESILLYSSLNHQLTDVGPKFIEERHAKGFKSSSFDHVWKIVEKSQSTDNSDPSQTSAPELPSELGPLLNDLNLAQRKYDAANHQIATLQQQLYLDWNKYMHARYPSSEERGNYPDADQIMYFLANYSFAELDNLVASTGTVTFGDESTGFKPDSGSSATTSLAALLAAAWGKANATLPARSGTSGSGDQPEYQLVIGPGPRYWEAHDPVIMIAGLDNGACDEPSLTSLLSATLYASNQTVNETGLSTSGSHDILTLCSGKNGHDLSKQKWNPFILDWEVKLLNAHLHDQQGAYSEWGLQGNFDLNQYGPDFLQKGGYTEGKLSVFSGTVLMSSHASNALMKGIETFIQEYFASHRIQNQPQNFLKATSWSSVSASLSKTESQTASGYQNPIYTAWKVYADLSAKNTLAQTLNGFNQASIMQKKTPQLPIAEPIGFHFEQQFTGQVKDKVGNERHTSPIMAFDFLPIRTGQLTLSRLSLIDNFGVPVEVDPTSENTIIADTLKTSEGDAYLKPRLVQPARLTFRWLAAGSNMEMNSHTVTSPICGWLMADYFNGAVVVYATSGHALGSVDKAGVWNTVPWSNSPSDLTGDISNIHLLKTVQKLCGNPTFLADFLSTTQSAQNNIAPPNAHLFNTKSMLMGKPIAVVRATVGFELQGLPAIDQSWSSLLTDMHNCTTDLPWRYAKRNSDNWSTIKLPLRLGEHSQLNDGLIGYWIEDNQGNLRSTFYSPSASAGTVNDADVSIYNTSNSQVQWMCLGEEPVNMTMLINPHGLVHATTGILPVKAISIPPSHYLPAMEKMRMWFRSTGILQLDQRKGKEIKLDLPPISGYKWQWWDKFHGLQEVAKRESSTRTASPEVWDGWLLLTPENVNS